VAIGVVLLYLAPSRQVLQLPLLLFQLQERELRVLVRWPQAPVQAPLGQGMSLKTIAAYRSRRLVRGETGGNCQPPAIGKRSCGAEVERELIRYKH